MELQAAYFCSECNRRFDAAVDSVCPDDGAKLLPVLNELDLVGHKLDDRYTIEKQLGIGGMGVVYKAFQHSVERHIAVKVLKTSLTSDPVSVNRFFKEAKSISKLRHPHTVTLFDFGHTKTGLLYMTMELLEGDSLTDVIYREGPLSCLRALNILSQVCDSLCEAHDLGLIHRDLKPENIQLEVRHGQRDYVKVLDFGIAKAIWGDNSPSVTAAGRVCGTPAYMSPEAAEGKQLDHRADLYSLGIVLYEMLGCRVPFDGDTPVGVLMQQAGAEIPRLENVGADVPPQVLDLMYRLLEKDPELRPDDAHALKREIESCQGLLQNVENKSRRARTEDNLPAITDEMAVINLDLTGADLPAVHPTQMLAPVVERRPVRLFAFVAAAFALVTTGLVGSQFGQQPLSFVGEQSQRIIFSPPPAPAKIAPPTTSVPDSKPVEVRGAAAPVSANESQSEHKVEDSSEPLVRAHSVLITVKGAPANVFSQGQLLGKTPHRLELNDPGMSRVVLLKRRGSRQRHVQIDSRTPETLEVTLRPAKKRRLLSL